jgi:hypothetical protein
MFKEVLLVLNVEYWGSEVLELSCCLWHLELLRDLHDFFEFWEQARREDVF